MIIKRAKEVFRLEAEAVRALANKLDHNFVQAVEVISGCKGRVVVSGMGKAGIIGPENLRHFSLFRQPQHLAAFCRGHTRRPGQGY